MRKIITIAVLALFALSACTKNQIIIKYEAADRVVDTLYAPGGDYTQIVSVLEFGVSPSNSASANKTALQYAFDWASANGAALYLTPQENGYRVASGLVLRKNVTLYGSHGPTGRGTQNTAKKAPTGSVFVITDDSEPFITVESATCIKGIQFYYPNQTYTDPASIKAYPSTIQNDRTADVNGVTLKDLSFYGEYIAMDFRSTRYSTNDLTVDNCYGCPLSGSFVAVDRAENLTIRHSHVNPANQRQFGRGFDGHPAIIEAICAAGNYSYWIDHASDVTLLDIFTYGNHGGVYLGANSYGQLTSFNFDCVSCGIYRTGSEKLDRAWEISQGSIIANVGSAISDIHPILVTGYGFTSIVAVENFSARTTIFTTLTGGNDFIYVTGDKKLAVTLTNCRMYGYTSTNPINVDNPNASVRATSCVDKNGNFFDFTK